MKGLPTLIRMHRWELEEKRRQLADREELRDGFSRELARLEEQLIENQKVAAYDPEVAATYGAYALQVIEQRHVLGQSILEAQVVVDEAADIVHQAFQEVKKYETAQERVEARLLKEEMRREQIELDDIGLNMFRRNKGEGS